MHRCVWRRGQLYCSVGAWTMDVSRDLMTLIVFVYHSMTLYCVLCPPLFSHWLPFCVVVGRLYVLTVGNLSLGILLFWALVEIRLILEFIWFSWPFWAVIMQTPWRNKNWGKVPSFLLFLPVTMWPHNPDLFQIYNSARAKLLFKPLMQTSTRNLVKERQHNHVCRRSCIST